MQIHLSDHFTYKKLLRFTFPSILMMIFTSICSVVDGLFVSNFAGTTAFASVNLVMPFLMGLGGIGAMLGTGGSALVAKTLGEGDKDRANRYFTMMIRLMVIIGIVCSVIGIIFIRSLIFPVITIIVLPMIWGLDGIWLSLPVGEFLAVMISVMFLLFNRKKYQY